MNIPPEEWNVVDPIGNPDSLEQMLQRQAKYFERLAGVTELTVVRKGEKPKASATAVIPLRTATASVELFVPLAGMIDLDEERARLRRAIEEKQGFLAGVERKLRNEQFVSRAPEEVVQRERQKAADATAELQMLRTNLADLG